MTLDPRNAVLLILILDLRLRHEVMEGTLVSMRPGYSLDESAQETHRVEDHLLIIGYNSVEECLA